MKSNDSRQHKIVILEKDHNRREYLRNVIQSIGCIPFCFDNQTMLLENLQNLDPELAVIDVNNYDGVLNLLYKLDIVSPGLSILLGVGDAHRLEKINANGFNHLTITRSPIPKRDILVKVNQLASLKQRRPLERTERYLAGKSKCIGHINKSLPNLGYSNDTVLISGEMGTGKEHLARAIHSHSGYEAFVKVKLNELNVPDLLDEYNISNPGSLDKGLMNNVIEFDNVSNVTLLLEHIEFMPKDQQAELLDFLEKKNGARLPFDDNKEPKCRIIATTQKSGYQLLEDNILRKDLFYRLNVIHIHLPPLRERIEDIPLLCDYYLMKLSHEARKCYFGLSKDVLNQVIAYDWPGNVDELIAAVEKVVQIGHESALLSKANVHKRIEKSDISNEVADICSAFDKTEIESYLKLLDNFSLKEISDSFISKTESRVMRKVLSYTNWNRRKAAKVLNISYKSLLNKIKLYELN